MDAIHESLMMRSESLRVLTDDPLRCQLIWLKGIISQGQCYRDFSASATSSLASG
jgi:hypothetical protein